VVREGTDAQRRKYMLSFVGSGWLPRLLEAARFTGDREKGLTRHVHERWRAAICTAAVGAALMGTPCQSLADAQLSISPSTVAAVSSVSPASTMESLKEYDRRLNRAVFEDAWGAVYTMFYDHTAGSRFTNDDWREERDRIISNGTFVFSTRERTYDAIRDAVAAIGDPYTRFLTPDEWQAELASRTASVLNSAGVGLQLTDPFDGVEDLKVTAPLPESPAEEAGIAPGDYLVAIDGIDVAHARMTPDEAIAILRGTEGSPVYLDVLSGTDDELRKVTVNRRRLSMKPIKSEILENENGRLGYVRVHFFISSAREALIEEVTKMVGSGVDGIVLDVRNCLGGIFQEALGMGALFFDRPDCILAKTVDGNGIEREHIVEKQDCILPQMRVTQVPLAVLVNGGSARWERR